MSDMVYCRIVIKKKVIPYNMMLTYADRAKEQKRIDDEYRVDFYKVLNHVVNEGGVFCHSKDHFYSDYKMYDQNVKIKLPLEKVESIGKDPLVESITII